MILTNSTAANVGASAVKIIASATNTFRQFMVYSQTTITSVISGAIGLVKNGPAGLILSGVCNYTGETIINQGAIAITSASTLNGVIRGVGSITKSGVGTLTLGGNNTYSGGTTFVSGIISYTSSTAFGTGLFTQGGGTYITTAINATLTNNFQITSGTLQYRTGGANSITVTGNIAGSGNLNKTGNGTLQLDGTLTYTGSTTITAGFIRAIKTSGASTATATFQSAGLSLVVSFNVAPPSGVTTFRFFQGTTTQTYAAVTLVGLPSGSTATYNSANSTLSVTVP